MLRNRNMWKQYEIKNGMWHFYIPIDVRLIQTGIQIN
jgi:hypothetical protein